MQNYSTNFCLVSLQILNNWVVENQVLIDTWDQKDVDARMIIYCNIEPKLQVLLEGCRTAADMWDRLILQFAQAAAANANLLLNNFDRNTRPSYTSHHTEWCHELTSGPVITGSTS